MSRMEAKDGSMGFDFKGTFLKLKENSLIRYSLEDDGEVTVEFAVVPDGKR